MATLRVERREASSGRVPAPRVGQALVFTRYQRERAVVLHPDDFRRLATVYAALDEQARIEPSDAALTAHLAEDTPGTPIEDASSIVELLGL